jgi:hypothetical protein
MISIIISSANKSLLTQVSQNIENTIGITYELIALDNSGGNKGICEVYDFLCFMHEDVNMKTANWGQVVLDIFAQNPGIGLIGLAGSSYRPLSPCAWNGHGSEYYYLNVFQHYKHISRESGLTYHNPGVKKLAPVVSVDGVWFCTTKALAYKYPFDQSIKGFHGYDLDFSLSIRQEKNVAVTFDILLEHFSDGKCDEIWLENIVQLYDKWFQHFPIQLEPMTKSERISIERRTFKYFIALLAQSNLSLNVANHFLWKDNRFIKLNFWLFIKLHFYILMAWIQKTLGIQVK